MLIRRQWNGNDRIKLQFTASRKGIKHSERQWISIIAFSKLEFAKHVRDSSCPYSRPFTLNINVTPAGYEPICRCGRYIANCRRRVQISRADRGYLLPNVTRVA